MIQDNAYPLGMMWLYISMEVPDKSPNIRKNVRGEETFLNFLRTLFIFNLMTID